MTSITRPWFFIGAWALAVCCLGAAPQARILDLKHYSEIFGEERNFRVFLPPGYDQAVEKRYPVVYFFHGHGERYNRPPRSGRGYDSGDDYGGDNIAAFVGGHDVIVVRWDGHNPRTRGEDYVRPYNISPVETYRQFPLYFPELVRHIDSHFRTIADREHRATAGLSMGGFMSFWVAGKYPHLVGSASNFMGSSEFYVGPNGFPVEYRHTEMYRNYEGLRTRIVIGSRDFIRWYHRRMNLVWDFVRPSHEHEEFDWDHGTPGMAKTLSFHMAAFRDPLARPALWHHIDVYPVFDVWGYSVQSDRRRPGFTLIENVSGQGFRSSVREWLPDGGLMPSVTVRITTDAQYRPGKAYRITDVNLDTGVARQSQQVADGQGRLYFLLNGARHEIGISDEERPILTVSGWQVAGAPWATAGKPVRLRLSLLNKGSAPARKVTVQVTSPNPGVTIERARLNLRSLAAGASAETTDAIVFRVQDPDREIVKFEVKIQDGQGRSATVPIEVPLFRDAPEIRDFVLADGRKLPLWVRAVESTEKVLGAGNGDGAASPGETIAIAIRDGEAYRAAELFTSEPCVDATAPRERLSDVWSRYDHVGASAKISLPLLSSSCKEGQEIPFFVRYQIPNKPDHTLKEGVVRVRVSGSDRTPPQVRWARLGNWNRVEVEIRDGTRVRKAVATLRNADATLRLTLNDEGRDGDAAAGDSVFSGVLPNPDAGPYRLSVFAEDESGNSADTAVEGEFQWSLPRSPAEVR